MIWEKSAVEQKENKSEKPTKEALNPINVEERLKSLEKALLELKVEVKILQKTDSTPSFFGLVLKKLLS